MEKFRENTTKNERNTRKSPKEHKVEKSVRGTHQIKEPIKGQKMGNENKW